MDRSRQTGLMGRLGERKKDDCGYNYTQFKAASQETLGAAVNRNVAVVCAFQKYKEKLRKKMH